MNILSQTTYTDEEIGRILKKRVCARCYGHLTQFPGPDRTWIVKCLQCGDAWGGTHISRYTAERRAARGLAEAQEVKQNLSDLFPNPNKGKSAKQLLEELGY